MLKACILQHVPFEGPGNIATWLSARNAQIRTVRVFAGDPLPAPAEVDLVIALSGPMSVQDEWFHDWIPAEKRFLSACIEQHKAVLGICFGAQLIASALGAKISPNEHREMGWFDIVPTSENEHVFRFPANMKVLHWHDETFDLPPGAQRIARSEACANQAFQFGERVMALQFHLETTPESLDARLETYGDELEPLPFVQDETAIRAGLPTTMATNHQWLSAVLDWITRQPAKSE